MGTVLTVSKQSCYEKKQKLKLFNTVFVLEPHVYVDMLANFSKAYKSKASVAMDFERYLNSLIGTSLLG